MVNKYRNYLYLSLVVMVLLVFTGELPAQFGGGEGSEDDPWIISTATHLDSVRYYLEDYFLQDEDIDLGVAPWNEGEGWEPIGTELVPFEGHYDGGGNLIIRPTINRPETFAIGVFGYIADATITDVGVIDADITGAQWVGALVGRMDGGTVTYSFHEGGIVRGESRVGGFIGITFGLATPDPEVHYCYSTAEAIAYGETDGIVGSFVGFLSVGTNMSNCYATGRVSGINSAGGFAGRIYLDYQATEEGYVELCYSTGWVDSPDTLQSGGFAGWVIAGDVENSFWNVETSGRTFGGDGISADFAADTEDMLSDETYEDWDFDDIWEISDGTYPYFQWQENTPRDINYPGAYNLKAVAGVEQVTLTWEIPPLEPDMYFIYRQGTVIDSVAHPILEYVDEDVEYQVNLEYYVTIGYEDDIESGPSNKARTMLYFPGSGEENNPYQIATATDLNYVKKFLGESYSDIYFIQTANISLADTLWSGGTGWEPIGTDDDRFFANYNGNGMLIDSLTIDDEFVNNKGLFGFIEDAEIINLGLTNVNISANDHIGGLVAQAFDSNIENCFVTGDIAGYYYVGGLIGIASDTVIKNCYTRGSVEGDYIAAGLIADLRSSTVENCFSASFVDCDDFAGGLIGVADDSDVDYSYWDLAVSDQESSFGGEGKSTADMTYPYDDDTYEDWDFNNIWGADTSYLANDGYPYLLYQFSAKPSAATKPVPKDQATDVPVNLEYLNWSYIIDPFYIHPVGFRVYFNQTGEFDEENDYFWVPFVDEQEEYSCSEVPDLEPLTDYYWMVVPTTEDPNRGRSNDSRIRNNFLQRTSLVNTVNTRNDAEDVVVWSFTTGLYPAPNVASNPLPEDEAIDILVDLEELAWSYIVDTTYVNPLGFRVYFGTDPEDLSQHGSFIEYEDGQESYSISRVHAPHLLYETTYYWQVVPTTIDPDDGRTDDSRRRRVTGSQRKASVAIEYRGDAEDCPIWSFTTEIDTSVDPLEPPLVTELKVNYPNPFNPSTTIQYSLQEATEVSLTIYNILGQNVKQYNPGIQQAGRYELIWEGINDQGRPVSSGVYYYRLTTDHYEKTYKMMLIK